MVLGTRGNEVLPQEVTCLVATVGDDIHQSAVGHVHPTIVSVIDGAPTNSSDALHTDPEKLRRNSDSCDESISHDQSHPVRGDSLTISSLLIPRTPPNKDTVIKHNALDSHEMAQNGDRIHDNTHLSAQSTVADVNGDGKTDVEDEHGSATFTGNQRDSSPVVPDQLSIVKNVDGLTLTCTGDFKVQDTVDKTTDSPIKNDGVPRAMEENNIEQIYHSLPCEGRVSSAIVLPNPVEKMSCSSDSLHGTTLPLKHDENQVKHQMTLQDVHLSPRALPIVGDVVTTGVAIEVSVPDLHENAIFVHPELVTKVKHSQDEVLVCTSDTTCDGSMPNPGPANLLLRENTTYTSCNAVLLNKGHVLTHVVNELKHIVVSDMSAVKHKESGEKSKVVQQNLL